MKSRPMLLERRSSFMKLHSHLIYGLERFGDLLFEPHSSIVIKPSETGVVQHLYDRQLVFKNKIVHRSHFHFRLTHKNWPNRSRLPQNGGCFQLLQCARSCRTTTSKSQPMACNPAS